MTELSLKKSGRHLEDHYDVVADGAVVGRIMLFTTTPTGLPWVWTMAPGHEDLCLVLQSAPTFPIDVVGRREGVATVSEGVRIRTSSQSGECASVCKIVSPRSIFVEPPHSCIVGHSQPFVCHDEPVIFLTCGAAPLCLQVTVFRAISIFLRLGDRGHFLFLIRPTRLKHKTL
jgi:hypothetical protein